jgi:hypothetical protein
VQSAPTEQQLQKYVTILTGTLSQSFPGAIDWQSSPDCSHVPVLGASWVTLDDQALGAAGRYLIFRIASIDGVRPGSRVRCDGESYAIRRVNKSARTGELELWCETLGDFIANRIRSLRSSQACDPLSSGS